MDLVGCGTALVTPFRADGAIDEPALRALISWQIGPAATHRLTQGNTTFAGASDPSDAPEDPAFRNVFQPVRRESTADTPGATYQSSSPVPAGVDWLVACGTTAETPTLSHEEWLYVLQVTAAEAAGRVPVWAGCTSNSTREAVERAQAAARVPGISAILTANPYYNKPGQEGQFQHFQAIAKAIHPFELVLYNIPGRTSANLEPATVLRLAEACDNIAAIKESSGSLAQITELLTLLPRRFQVYAGDDAMALGVLGAGGAGLVSVASNAIPAEMAQMVRAALANDWATARHLNHMYFPLMLANFLEPSPGPVKALLAMMGRLHETYRLPIVPVAAATRERLHTLAGQLGLLAERQPAHAATARG